MNSGKYQFQKLTPTPEAKIEVYEDALNFVFDNPDVHNIAVSGAYGAGKSSLIESYKAKHSDKKFLHLSLAHFVPTEDADCPIKSDPQENVNTNSSVKESVLEGKILNQLLHQISADKLPQSNFKIKREIKPRSIAILSFSTVICVLSFLRIVLRHQLQYFTNSLNDNLLKQAMICISQPYWMAVAIAFCTVYAAWLIYKVIWLQKNRNFFKRINLHGSEIEIFEEQDESYFDKYLNEVLYLFENSGADVIVFEDMDRFNSSQIFERLHEINRLINVQRMKDKKDYRPLRFFYLLRDDMFVSKDRTKFFDFILPVVPVVDASNSYDKFLEIFKENGYLEKFNKSFLQGLALYVDDMRILKNICNEFTVYINRVDSINLNWDKMLALITYKNIFPRDFSDLQLGRGFIYELFQQKWLLIQNNLPELEKQREELKRKLEKLDNELIQSRQELDDVFEAMKRRLTTVYRNGYCIYSKESQEIYDRYTRELPIRKQIVEINNKDGRDKITAELAKVEHQIQHIETAPLKDLITRENIGQLFSLVYTNEIGQRNDFKEIKSSNYFPLLKFLIRNGYMDETYPDYMSYFYEESISAHDKMFLRKITDQLGAEYTYSLKNPEKIVECPVIQNVAFEQEETLNFDLLNYLLKHLNDDHNDEYVNIMIAQLRDTKRFDFIAQYYKLDRSRQQFVVKLNEQWNGFFQKALQGSGFTSEQVKQYSLDTLYCSASEIIQAVNCDGCLRRYISETPEYLAISYPDTGKLMEGFELLNVSIEKLIDKGVSLDLLNNVYQKDLYVLNAENITFILKRKYGVTDETEIQHKNFTLISNKQEEPLHQYILKNLPVYAEVMLSISQNEIRDTEDAAVKFLNFEEVDAGKKSQYITALTINIFELTEIVDTKLWPQLVNDQKIDPTIENLLHFYLQFGLDELLISYVNRLPNSCDFQGIADEFEESDRKNLFSSIVRHNDIENKQYEMILVGLGFTYWEFSLSNIADDKISILIKSGILQMAEQELKFIRRAYPDHLFEFIHCNWDAYLNLQSDDIANQDEIEEILNWDIPDEQKLHLLSFVHRALSVVGKSYSDEITSCILEQHYENDDFITLCLNYSEYGAHSKAVILDKAVERQYYICSYGVQLDDSLISELLCNESVNESYKLSIFVKGIPRMDENMCKKHFHELGLSKLCYIFDKRGGHYNYDKTDAVKQILEGLKQNKWIYSYSVDSRNPKKYVVAKNEPNHVRRL